MTMSEKGVSCLFMVIVITFSIYLYMMDTFFFFIQVRISSFRLRHFRNMMFSGSSIVYRFQKETAKMTSVKNQHFDFEEKFCNDLVNRVFPYR